MHKLGCAEMWQRLLQKTLGYTTSNSGSYLTFERDKSSVTFMQADVQLIGAKVTDYFSQIDELAASHRWASITLKVSIRCFYRS
jgi:hypothetical protein